MRKQSGTPQNNSLGQDLFQGFLVFILVVSILFIAFGIIGAALGQDTEPTTDVEEMATKKAMETTLRGTAAAIAQTLEDDVKRITVKEWKEEGTKRFGQDPAKWRFVCQNCKHVQTIQDFIDIRDLGMFEGSAEIALYNTDTAEQSRHTWISKGVLRLYRRRIVPPGENYRDPS